MEYLTMAEVGRMKLPVMEATLAGGVAGHYDWRLGTREEFYVMVQNHLSRPVSGYSWNDLFLSDGTVVIAGDEVLANLDNPTVSLMRSGDVDLARELKSLILMLGGINADPAFSMGGMGTADLDGGNRYTSGLQAYYKSDTGTSISRNNVIGGPESQGTRSLANEYIINRNWFVVRQVPEPGTMLILGLGGLVLIRKRK
jgi:hypothetical protein